MQIPARTGSAGSSCAPANTSARPADQRRGALHPVRGAADSVQAAGRLYSPASSQPRQPALELRQSASARSSASSVTQPYRFSVVWMSACPSRASPHARAPASSKAEACV